jgi:predicted phosphoadenosine phosphosulfate sulfurtransferase
MRSRKLRRRWGEGRSVNVFDAANERMALIFRDFDNVLVAFSCGKDSGVLLNLAYDYAKRTGQLEKLGFYYEDYEAGYRFTHEYAERTFRDLDVKRKFWLCLPISAACSVSMYEPRWIPWNPDQRDIWVRDFPKGDYVVTEANCPYPFVKGTKGFDARIQFSEWYAKEHGRTAVLIGLRAQESLTRRAIFTSQHRRFMHRGLRYSKTISPTVVNFYPLYDWRTSDIWVANARMGWDYNKVYDLYYQAGLTIDQMRVASPFHQSGQANLKLYRVIDPNNWGRMVGRVNGCNFGGIYGSTSAMAWRNVRKPDHFTWKEYANFLINTLPAPVKKKFLGHLNRLMESWESNGYGRNPRVIQAMKDEGIEVENTGEICKKCTKPDTYEIVKIKSGFPDETKVHSNFRICPSWKAVCVTIMKNDFTGTYMGCQRTVDQNVAKARALERYKGLRAQREAKKAVAASAEAQA